MYYLWVIKYFFSINQNSFTNTFDEQSIRRIKQFENSDVYYSMAGFACSKPTVTVGDEVKDRIQDCEASGVLKINRCSTYKTALIAIKYLKEVFE